MMLCLTLSLFLVWSGNAKSDVDLLSRMLHRMSSLEGDLLVAKNLRSTKPDWPLPCPASLATSGITLPQDFLSSHFPRETDAVQQASRLLNNFLAHYPPESASFDRMESVARSAAGILLENNERIFGGRFCWLRDVNGHLIEPTTERDNLMCRAYRRKVDAAPSTQLPTGESVQVQSIAENPKEIGPRIAEIWTHITANKSAPQKRAAWISPYLDCNNTWLITYLVGVSGRQDSIKRNFTRGVFGIDVLFNKYVDVNQCGDEEHPMNPFAATHKCKKQSTRCLNVSGEGFRKGAYVCECLPGFYKVGGGKAFRGTDVEEAHYRRSTQMGDAYEMGFDCLRCSPDCLNCTNGNPCVVTYDIITRGLPLGALAFCITCSIFVGGAVYRYRKRKVIASATWPLLENIVIGAILIYGSVIVRYFHPSFHRCLLEPWLREMGFMFFYCAVLLKLYKVVTEFRTRKAHCVYVRDKDLVKYHVGIILITIGFMAAWTSVTLDLNRDGRDLLLTLSDHDGLRHKTCRVLWWDYVAETCEVLLLLWGIYLSYLARNSKTLYMERRLLTAAICVELIVSTVFYVVIHSSWRTMHPDALYLLHFTRSQLTVTMNMFIIFGGKVWYIFRPQDDPFRKNQAHGTQGRPAEMEKLHDGIFAGDLELNQIPLSEMDHADIRLELRRLYAQMQVLKTKAMRHENPHISKKKGGRKIPHRRFSIQAFKTQCSRHPKEDEETTAAKTPEESSISGEITHAETTHANYEEESSYMSPEHNRRQTTSNLKRANHATNSTKAVGFIEGTVTNL